MAKRFGRIGSLKDWGTCELRPVEVTKTRKKYAGTVMFPTSHDITRQVVKRCAP
jgi:hypothetical protein